MAHPDKWDLAFGNPLFDRAQTDSEVSGNDFLGDKRWLGCGEALLLCGGERRHSF
jgi:hypothetical protein